MMEWYFRELEAGAPWSFLVLLGQSVLLAMVLERAVFLNLKARINVKPFLDALSKLTADGTAERAVKLTKAVNVPAARVCRVGLEGLGQSPFFLAEELDRAIQKELPAIGRRLGAIPLLGVAVAVLGVLASVLGGAGAPNFGGSGPLPFGLGEEHAVAVVGVAWGVLGVLAGVGLAARARRTIADLERCKGFVLDLSAGWEQGAPRAQAMG